MSNEIALESKRASETIVYNRKPDGTVESQNNIETSDDARSAEFEHPLPETALATIATENDVVSAKPMEGSNTDDNRETYRDGTEATFGAADGSSAAAIATNSIEVESKTIRKMLASSYLPIEALLKESEGEKQLEKCFIELKVENKRNVQQFGRAMDFLKVKYDTSVSNTAVARGFKIDLCAEASACLGLNCEQIGDYLFDDKKYGKSWVSRMVKAANVKKVCQKYGREITDIEKLAILSRIYDERKLEAIISRGCINELDYPAGIKGEVTDLTASRQFLQKAISQIIGTRPPSTIKEQLDEFCKSTEGFKKLLESKKDTDEGKQFSYLISELEHFSKNVAKPFERTPMNYVVVLQRYTQTTLEEITNAQDQRYEKLRSSMSEMLHVIEELTKIPESK